MNTKQRQLIIARDGFSCVVCEASPANPCPYRGKNDELCKLLASTLLPAVYFKMEKTRPKYMTLQVDHIIGRVGPIEVTEAWHNVITICPCCHAQKGQIREMEVAYAAQFEGKESPEYIAAMTQEVKASPKRKAGKAKAAKSSYKWKKEKLKEKPNPKKKLGKTKEPPSSGAKYSSKRWSEFDKIPFFNRPDL